MDEESIQGWLARLGAGEENSSPWDSKLVHDAAQKLDRIRETDGFGRLRFWKENCNRHTCTILFPGALHASCCQSLIFGRRTRNVGN
jgi:hypothetical protein